MIGVQKYSLHVSKAWNLFFWMVPSKMYWLYVCATFYAKRSPNPIVKTALLQTTSTKSTSREWGVNIRFRNVFIKRFKETLFKRNINVYIWFIIHLVYLCRLGCGQFGAKYMKNFFWVAWFRLAFFWNVTHSNLSIRQYPFKACSTH